MNKSKNRSKEDLFKLLDELKISYLNFEHEPIFTAQEAIKWKDVTPGLHCKNLFLQDTNGKMYLLTMPAFVRANLKEVSAQLGSGRLSFVKPERMLEILGVEAGHATPFAFINESSQKVQCVLSADILSADTINIHPLINSSSTVIAAKDLLIFLEHVGHKPITIFLEH